MKSTSSADLFSPGGGATKGAEVELTPEWAAICAGTRHTKVIPFPRLTPDGKPVCFIRIRNLSVLEANNAAAAAHKKAVEAFRAADPEYKGPVDTTSDAFKTAYDNASALEQIKIQCRRFEDPSLSFFPLCDAKHAPTTAAESVLSLDEIASLSQQLLILRHELNPMKYELTEPEILDLVERSRVSGNADFFWSFVSLDLAIPLVKRLAAMLSTSPANSSDFSAPSEEPSFMDLSKSEKSA